jgi:hypothetical protein
MPGTAFQYSPSAGSKISVSISSTMTVIKGASGIPAFGPNSATYDTTSIDDSAKSYGKDVPDPGKFKLTGIWDSTDPGQAYLYTAAGTPNQVDSFEVDFQKKQNATTAAKATFSAVILSFQFSAEKGKPQSYECEVQISGAITLAPAE